MLTLSEKIKNNGEVSVCWVNNMVVSTQEIERATEEMAILMNDGWHSTVLALKP